MTAEGQVEAAQLMNNARAIEKFPLRRSVYAKRWPSVRMRSNIASHHARNVIANRSWASWSFAAGNR